MKPKYIIEPVGGGQFTVKKATLFSYEPFIIKDISPGHGCDEIWPMKGSKADCLKVLRFLKYCKNVKTVIHWTIMDKIRRKLKIDFTYLK
jgi:hypothetical protein